MLVYVIVDNPTVSEDESVSAGLAIKIEKMVMESIIPYMNIPYSSDTEPETTTIAEETSATEASTDSEGNMIPASASASFNEVVPSEGYLNDPTESGESRTVSGSENRSAGGRYSGGKFLRGGDNESRGYAPGRGVALSE